MKRTRAAFCLVVCLLAVSSAFASAPVPRMAARAEREDYLDASIRFYSENARLNSRLNSDASVYASAKPVDQATFERVPEWDAAAFGTLESQFERIRDLRFIEDPEDAAFQRRSSWLYPDDGCFARASLAIQNLGLTAISVAKVYVFGNLKVNTTNHPRGYVTWWYHVVPIVSQQGERWVLDPAVEPRRPLTLTEWLQAVNVDGDSLSIAICQGDTLHPFDECWSPNKQDSAALDLQKDYLRAERRRLVDMGREVVRELGDAPPWLAPVPMPTLTPTPIPSQEPSPISTPTTQPSPVVTGQPTPAPTETPVLVPPPAAQPAPPVIPSLWQGILDGFRRVLAPAS